MTLPDNIGILATTKNPKKKEVEFNVTVPVSEAKATIEEKLARLKQILRDMGSVVIAFSGGADSALAYKVAADVLGAAALGVTGRSPSVPENDLKQVQDFVKRFGLNHAYVDTSEVQSEDYRQNPINRCYFCKDELYSRLDRLRQERGIVCIVDGTNADDLNDHRPGMQAARRLGVRSPLQEAGLTKEDIRELSRGLGLPTWNKPATACLASRFPYGVSISSEKLRMVDRCETFLRNLGLEQIRLRHHDKIARIEVLPKDYEIILRNHSRIVDFLKEAGYTYVTLDLQGFRSGSLNEGVNLSSQRDAKPKSQAATATRKEREPKFAPKTFGADIFTLYTDGGCIDNPGPAAFAYVLFSGQGKEVHRATGTLHRATNNVAEYHAVIAGLRYARQAQVERVHVLTDSQLLAKQIQGLYRVKNRDLQRLSLEVQALRSQLAAFEISFIPREENRLTDWLVRNCLKNRKKTPGGQPREPEGKQA